MSNLTQFFPEATSTNVLEKISFLCDGRSVTAADGTTVYTSQVAARQTATSSFQVWTGSQIAYTPPENTKTVTYEFFASIGHIDAGQLGHMYLDVDGTECTYSRRSFYGNSTYSSLEPMVTSLLVGEATENIAQGKIGTWTSNKTLSVKCRNYSASYEFIMNDLNYWNGAGSDVVAYPTLIITACS